MKNKLLLPLIAGACLTMASAKADGWLASFKYSKGYDYIFVMDDGNYSHESLAFEDSSSIDGFTNQIGFEVGYDWARFGVSADHNIAYRKDNGVAYTTTYLNGSVHSDKTKDTFVVGTFGLGLAMNNELMIDNAPQIAPAFKLEFGVGKTIFENIVIQPFISLQAAMYSQDINKNVEVATGVFEDHTNTSSHIYMTTNMGVKLLAKF